MEAGNIRDISDGILPSLIPLSVANNNFLKNIKYKIFSDGILSSLMNQNYR